MSFESSAGAARALIGYTGFVGGALLAQADFAARFNSRNIGEIRGGEYELVVCAGAPAAKWIANSQPEADRANLATLMGHLEHVSAAAFVLISTVDVYRAPVAVDEATLIHADEVEPYGRHRYELEEFCRARFANLTVLRLPGLFGVGLKKNFLYDLIHTGASAWTDAESIFQFYDMARLWADLNTARAAGLPLANLATEPVVAREVAARCFGLAYTHRTEKPPVRYDMRTRHAAAFGGQGDYIMDAEAVYARIAAFVAAERERGVS